MKPQSIEPRKSCDLMNFCEMQAERLPAINIVNERFLRLFRSTISNLLREVTTVTVASVESLSFGGFSKSQLDPTFFQIFRLEKMDGPGLLALDQQLLYAMIDRLFGGKPNAACPVERKKAVTYAEVKIAEEILRLALEDYGHAWTPVYEAGTVPIRLEVNPSFVGVVPPDENALVSTFDLEFGGVKGPLSIALPYVSIFPARDRLIW